MKRRRHRPRERPERLPLAAARAALRPAPLQLVAAGVRPLPAPQASREVLGHAVARGEPVERRVQM
jgi:hypothetical protein